MSITLKAARVNKNLTQREAAEVMGISVETIKNWEAGRSYPNVIQLKKIEQTYDVSYNDINFLGFF